MPPRKMKLSPEGLRHAHRVAVQTLRRSFPGMGAYKDAVLLIYMIEDCLGERCHPTIGDSVRRRYPRELFRELDPAEPAKRSASVP